MCPGVDYAAASLAFAQVRRSIRMRMNALLNWTWHGAEASRKAVESISSTDIGVSVVIVVVRRALDWLKYSF
jgi:hypothetical protein